MKLYSLGTTAAVPKAIIGRITTAGIAPGQAREDHILFLKEAPPPADTDGYAAVLTTQGGAPWADHVPVVHSLTGVDYLADGDVVRIDPNGYVRTLYRRQSPNNFILTTDQCNSYCLMCSQPPKRVNDFYRLAEHIRLVDLMDPETKELVITGGEPTLLKDGFLRLIQHCKEKLPGTALHVLTNGRLFYYRRFAEALGAIGHPDLMLGIPVYSDVDSAHDYVVQAKGAFEQTVTGLHNLARHDVAVEIRVVLHALTYRRLPQTAEFIARNFPFAAQVALMGMEMVGFVHKNMAELWIDPHDYQKELAEATWFLFRSGLNVKIYNHQLCVLDRLLWPFACRSISDWKNIYLDTCDPCLARDRCGGFFESAAKKHSDYIKPLLDLKAPHNAGVAVA